MGQTNLRASLKKRYSQLKGQRADLALRVEAARQVGGKAIDRHSASVLKLGWDYVRSLNAEHDLNRTKAEVFPGRNYDK